MKLFRKLLALCCALGVLASIPALAAEPMTLDPDYQPEIWIGDLPDEDVSVPTTDSETEYSPLDPNYQPEIWIGDVTGDDIPVLTRGSETDVECMVPYNSGSGTTGIPIFTFQAKDSNTVKFKIKWNLAGPGDTYHYVLWRSNENGLPATMVGTYHECSFDVWQAYDNLVMDAYYYVTASSTCVPTSGATCYYSYVN